MNMVSDKRGQISKAIENLDCGVSRIEMLVGQIMTEQPCCVSPNESVLELIRIFHDKQFRHLLVADKSGNLIGIISDRDVVRCLGHGSRPDCDALSRIKAAEIMSTDLVTVGPQTTLSRVVKIMLEQGISCLPVKAEERLVGIVTNTDLHVVLLQLLQTISRP